MSRTPAATALVRRAEALLGFELPVRVRAWDGSEAGAARRPGDPLVVVRSRRALRHLVWQPGELGLARAYVRGDLDVEGDLAEALRRTWEAVRAAPPRRRSMTSRELLRGVGTAVRLGAVGPRPRRPASEARLRGALHTRLRDRAAISHHYDLSNDFYALLLDSRMTYSCGYWADDGPGFGLEDAQRAKLDLVCRKVGLRRGDRLVDIGCGWGALTLHAATEYDAHVTGVTLSGEQRDFVERRAKQLGVEGRVDVRLEHFRDLHVDDADAVVSLEMGEHVGDQEYADFTTAVHSLLRPGGRALVQQMSRGAHAPGGGAFIERYIAPDMHMRPLQQTLGLFADAGLEIRHVEALREHYPRTVRAWADRLEDHWSDAVALVGEEVARVWRLYLAGGSLAFEQNRMGVDQVLFVRPTDDGRSLMPATTAGWVVPGPARP